MKWKLPMVSRKKLEESERLRAEQLKDMRRNEVRLRKSLEDERFALVAQIKRLSRIERDDRTFTGDIRFYISMNPSMFMGMRSREKRCMLAECAGRMLEAEVAGIKVPEVQLNPNKRYMQLAKLSVWDGEFSTTEK